MISAAAFRKMALGFKGVSEKPHFNKASFRIKEKIFATLDSVNNSASLKLSEADQPVYCQIKPTICMPATGAWGKQGWTIFDLKKVSKSIVSEALKKAYIGLAPAKNVNTRSSKTAEEKIQTLHPDKSKTNKKISLDKYNSIKKVLLEILRSNELTHTELMESLYQKVKDSFEGGVQWYGETVKLDLEARKIIERTRTKPDRYRLKAKRH